jgi:hypothetical protein
LTGSSPYSTKIMQKKTDLNPLLLDWVLPLQC